jgi:aminoglycoside phosphotransferase (APT) family kinase protein
MPAGDWDYLGIYGAVMRNPFFSTTLHNLEDTASHELTGRIFGTTSVDAVQSVFAKFNEVGRALRDVTTVFAHNDCHADNLYPIETDGVLTESVAIDWATAGLGPIGEDVGNLSAVGAQWFSIDVDDFESYEKAIFDRYVEGAESVAGSIDIDHARTGYLAGLGYWGLAKMMMRAYAATMFPQAVNRMRSLSGMPEQEVARKWGVLTDKLYPYAVECVERLGV